MEKRSYSQFCAIARALDVVGERWTLLLVRELLSGPRRFSDLVHGLPGIGTNLLTRRLRELETAGVVDRRTLPPPASSAVYALTPRGLRLRPVVVSLGAWGQEQIATPGKGETVRPWWSLLLLTGRFYRPGAQIPAEMVESYELHADGEVFHVSVEAGKLTMGQGAARRPTAIVRADGETIAAVLAGRVSFTVAVERGRVAIDGDAKALRRFAKLLDLPLEGAR